MIFIVIVIIIVKLTHNTNVNKTALNTEKPSATLDQ